MAEDNNFSSNFVEIAKKYGPAAIAAALLLGGGNTYLASKTKPANETAKQRRHRLLRAFLSPTITAAGGALALGAAKALAATPSLNSAETDKAISTLNSMSGLNEAGESKAGIMDKITEVGTNTALPTLATGLGAFTGAKMIGDPLVNTVRAWGPNTRTLTRMVGLSKPSRSLIHLLGRNPKTKVLSKVLRNLIPNKKAIPSEVFESRIAPIIKLGPTVAGGVAGFSAERGIENLVSGLTIGDDLPEISQAQLDKVLKNK